MSDNPLAGLAALQLPDPGKMASSASSALKMVTGFEVIDNETYALAAEELRAIKAQIKRLEELRVTITGPLLSAKQATDKLFKGPADILAQAEKEIKAAMIGYSQRVEQEAEAARQAQAAAVPDDFEAALEMANTANVVALAPAAAGISKVKTTLKARVTDLPAFLAFALSRPELLSLVSVDEAKLNALVKALGGTAQYPGVEGYTVSSIAARAA